MIDPTTKRVTHLVVKAQQEPWVERLVPVELVDRGDGSRRAVTLRAPAEDVRSLPPVQQAAYLQLGDFPIDHPDRDVGIQEVYALPYSPTYDPEPQPLDCPVVYDRIPKGEVEIRRASGVYSAEGHHLGHVDGFLIDRDQHITHVVLERGHLRDRRDVTIPIGAVAKVETDDVTLSLTNDQVGSLPRWLFGAGRRRAGTDDDERVRSLAHPRQRRRAAWQRLGSDARQSPVDNSSEGSSNGRDGKRGRRRIRRVEQGLPGVERAQAV